MDAINEKGIHTVVIMSSAQVGKTEILNNMVGFIVDRDPSPIMLVQPTIEMAQAWSKDRLEPMVRDTPALTGKIKIKSRDGDSKILHKKFHGGHITMSGANSPASLASRPIRVLLLDEVDRFPTSAGEEGDPVNLAIKRTTTFWNKKIVMVSTPTVKDQSRIEAAFKASDQRRFEVPCPHCDEYDVLKWSNLRRPHEEARPEEWEYFCSHCGTMIEEKHKMQMLRAGRWSASSSSDGVAGFWINELYSPWVSWAEMVANFLEAKKLPDTLKTFINTSLAETWDQDREGDGVSPDAVADRVEEYRAEVPSGVYMLTASVDVQDDRLEVEVLGWGLDRETWSIQHRVIWGDPAISDVWDQLSDIIQTEFQHEEGVTIKIAIAVIDAGGHHAEQVYQYTKDQQRRRRRIYAIRGSSVRNRPIVDKVSRNNDYRVKVFYLGTDTAKEMIYSYLTIAKHGAGFMHHPTDYDEAYFQQLTAERKVVGYEKGKSVTKWVLPSGKRNEALDLKVYNFAAYRILKPDMAAVKKRFEDRVNKKRDSENGGNVDNGEQGTASSSKKKITRRRKGNFAKNW